MSKILKYLGYGLVASLIGAVLVTVLYPIVMMILALIAMAMYG